jgi:hypothetical protein
MKPDKITLELTCEQARICQHELQLYYINSDSEKKGKFAVYALLVAQQIRYKTGDISLDEYNKVCVSIQEKNGVKI